MEEPRSIGKHVAKSAAAVLSSVKALRATVATLEPQSAKCPGRFVRDKLGGAGGNDIDAH